MAEDGGTTDRENALLRSWPTATPAPIPASTVGLFQGSSGNALNNSTANAANRDIWNVGNVHFHLPPSHVGQGLSSLLQPLTMFSYIFSTFTGLIPRTAVTVGSPQERVPDTTTPSDPPAATPGLATALPDPTVSDAESGDAQATENIQIESGDFHITWVDDLDLEGQHQALSGTTSAEEIYVRNLYPTTHGYPCANPCTLGRPVRIGDVGELTSHGFRALKHLSDCQIPSLQSQLPLFGLSDPLHDSEYLCEGDSITGGIAGWETGFVPGSETIRSIEYRCQAFEGAILAATSPAQLHTVDSDNLRQLRLWLCKHGIDLVHLLSPGQCEPLFIVTGIVTSSSWATATYPRLMEASHGPDSLVLSRLSQELPQRYRWTRTSRQATTRSKASPSGINSQGERIKDQCLFLRGFLITPSPQHVKHQRQHALRHKDTKPMRDRGLDGSRPDVVGTQNDRGEASSENINPSSSGYQSSAPQDRADEGASQDQLLVEEFPSSCSVDFYPSHQINKRLLELTNADLAITHDDDWRFRLDALRHPSTLSLPEDFKTSVSEVRARHPNKYLPQGDQPSMVGKHEESRNSEDVSSTVRRLIDPRPSEALIHGLESVRVEGGNITQVGRDVVRHHPFGITESSVEIPSFLQRIPNFRDIQIATLGKATAGTGDWIYVWTEFCIWLAADGHIRILWGSGIPGAGKTVLASIVINALETRARASVSPICVCYVYFRYRDHSTATVQTFLEVLVRQIIEQHPSCLAFVDELYARHVREETSPSGRELLGLLRRCAEMFMANFYILEALDEAPIAIQRDLVEELASLNVKLFITSRPMEDLEGHFPDVHAFPIAAREQDLDLYIADKISHSPELRALLENEDSTREAIASLIKHKCGGMFLHASLQIEALKNCVNIHQVMQKLEQFPARIEDVYMQTWDRILGQHPSGVLLAQNVLSWLVTASRPMTVEELRHALASCPDTGKFDSQRLVAETTLVRLCQGLVTVERESRLVRLIHYTANSILQQLILEVFPHPHSHLAKVCIVRLTSCGFGHAAINSAEELASALLQEPLLAYAYDSWAFHSRESMAVTPFRPRLAGFVVGCHAFPVAIGEGRQFEVLGPLHVVAFFNFPMSLIGIDAAQDPDIPTRNMGLSPLNLACQVGSTRAAEELLDLPRILVTSLDIDGYAPLHWASWHGSETVVKKLLVRPEIEINPVNNAGQTPLMLAALNGHTSTVKLLLARSQTDVNVADGSGKTAGMLASENGHTDIVELLLDHPKIQVNLMDKHGETALISASKKGHTSSVRLLLSHPESGINLVNTARETALMFASQNGHAGTVALFLAHPNVNVNLADRWGHTALILAASYGRDDVVKLLLAHPGIEVNLKGPNGRSALFIATLHGHEEIVKLFLAFPGIQVGPDMFFAASARGHANIAHLLKTVISDNHDGMF